METRIHPYPEIATIGTRPQISRTSLNLRDQKIRQIQSSDTTLTHPSFLSRSESHAVVAVILNRSQWQQGSSLQSRNLFLFV
ncbi:hypothetical protein U1Q18_042944 [Sarracenia purpurea var. burkii]